LSDKVHNARSILRDLRKPDIGSAVWGRFKQPKEDTLWYYRELANAFALLLPGQLADGNCDRTRKRIGDLSTRQASFAFQIQAFSLNLLKRLTEIVRLVNDNVSKWLVLAPGIVCRHLSVFIEFHAFAGNGYGTTRYLKKAFM
jgi:hypothetical protein